MPKRDLSFKVLLGYAQVADRRRGARHRRRRRRDRDPRLRRHARHGVRHDDHRIGSRSASTSRRIARATGDGYGVRGRYSSGGTIERTVDRADRAAPAVEHRSVGEPERRDRVPRRRPRGSARRARSASRSRCSRTTNIAVTAVGSVFLPFGEDEMLLGDRNLVFEPKLAVDWRKDRVHATRVVANVGARIRQRTVLEALRRRSIRWRPRPTRRSSSTSARELVVGARRRLRAHAARVRRRSRRRRSSRCREGASYGSCRRYNGARAASITDADYFGDAKAGRSHRRSSRSA